MKKDTCSEMINHLVIFKSRFLVAIIFCLFIFNVNGQVTNYSFSQSNSTYVALATSTIIHNSVWDDNVAIVPIPFSFTFNGVGYTSASVNSNGYITFGNVNSASNSYAPISSNSGYIGAISAFSRDLINNGSPVVYGIEGVTPNRIFVVQWNNARRYSLGAVAGDVLNFQIRLYESSNKSEVRYGANSATSTTALISQVGLRGFFNSDFNNRTSITSWNATTAGTANTATITSSNTILPVSGLTYTWTPTAAVYCTPAYENGPGTTDGIVNVKLGALNNNSGNSVSPFYTFFNNVTIPDIERSSTANVAVQYGSDLNQFGAVWIDFNKNNIFEASEGLISATNAGANGISTFSFTVPAGAVLGQTRMRVRGGNDFILNTDQACGLSSSSYGETEDYIVNIIAAVPCPTFLSTISIGGNTTTPGSLYPSLTAAVADLSRCGISQPTILSLNTNYNSTAETFPITIPRIIGSSAVNTLTVKPAPNVVKNISGIAPTGNMLLKIYNNFTIIDGSNTVGGTTKDLSITNTNTANSWIAGIVSGGIVPVTDVIFKNTILTNGHQGSLGLIISDGTIIANPGYFNNIRIQNNTIQKASYGLYINGNTAVNNGSGLVISDNLMSSIGANALLNGISIAGVDGGSSISNNAINLTNTSFNIHSVAINVGLGVNNSSISGNVISGAANTVNNYISAGIIVNSNATTLNIFDNLISNISSVGNFVDGSVGIEIAGNTRNSNIYGNKLFNIKNNNVNGYGAAGLFLGSSSFTSNISMYNNMIWDVAGYGYASDVADNGHGIYVYSGAGYRIYYNSVNMATNQQIVGVSSAIYISPSVTTASAIDLRTNIFANNQTTGTRYAIYSEAANTVFSNINYNDYYSSSGVLGYLGSARNNVANWRTATGKDANSIDIIPLFISPSDLHLTPCASPNYPAVAIAGITTDIDGDARSSTPNMGADEQLFIAPTAAATLTSSVIEIGCGIVPVNITLVASGGSVGSGGVSTLFYEGNVCPQLSYGNEFLNIPTTTNSTVGNLVNGIRQFTATTGDPMIHLENVLSAAIDPVKSKYIIIRYKVLASPIGTNNFEIYFKKNTLNLDDARVVRQIINTDGNWHIATIDMSANAEWNNTGGDITGWRFDYASLNGTVIDLDYILLADTSVLENANADDTSIVVNPLSTAPSIQYGTFRISECSSQIVNCSISLNKTVTNLDRTFNQNTVWNNASNWLQGAVPTINNCVVVPSGRAVEVNISTAAAKSVTVQSGGKLTINENQTLSVKETFANNAGDGDVMIESDGNLLQTDNVANTGAISARRKLSVKDNNQYNYLISPLIGTNLKTNIYETLPSGAISSSPATLYSVESTNRFQTSAGTYILGRALAVKEPVTGPGAGNTLNMLYKGMPMNGSFTYLLENSNSPTRTAYGYNLIGNPYPSNIDLNLFYNLNTNSSKISSTFYFWDNTVNSTAAQQGNAYNGAAYGLFNAVAGSTGTGIRAGQTTSTTLSLKTPTRIVKTGQGFMARSISTTNKTIDFNNSIRTSDLETVFFGKEAQTDRYWLNLSAPTNITTEMAVVYFSGGNNDFAEDDSETFGASSDAVYSILGEQQVLINGKAPFMANDKVFLGTRSFLAGNYTISLVGKEGVFNGNQTIYLKDKLTNVITNLTQGSYTFSANAGENNTRFEIIYQPETVLATDGKEKEQIVVYRQNTDFVIKSPKELSHVEMYDTSGKLIKALVLNSRQAVLDSSSLVSGVYILKIQTEDGEIYNKKIMK